MELKITLINNPITKQDLNMSKTQYISFLIHHTSLTNANVAKEIFEIGKTEFNVSSESLSGHDLNKWISGKRNIPKWAILSSFKIALKYNYSPENDYEWSDFLKTWAIIFKPSSSGDMIHQMESNGFHHQKIDEIEKKLKVSGGNFSFPYVSDKNKTPGI